MDSRADCLLFCRQRLSFSDSSMVLFLMPLLNIAATSNRPEFRLPTGLLEMSLCHLDLLHVSVV